VREEAAGRGLTDQGYQTHTIARKQQALQTICMRITNAISSSKKTEQFNQDLAAKSGSTSLPKLTVETNG
jgi:predicted transcriptional regulator